jgi:hypothetical protein
VFPVSRFEEVAEIVQPRKRRQLSEEQRARLASVGFRPGCHSQSEKTAKSPHAKPAEAAEVT